MLIRARCSVRALASRQGAFNSEGNPRAILTHHLNDYYIVVLLQACF